jgi:hypothetical protein
VVIHLTGAPSLAILDGETIKPAATLSARAWRLELGEAVRAGVRALGQAEIDSAVMQQAAGVTLK